MPRNNVRTDSCYQKAVEYLVKNPNLTVREEMTLADFSPREREDKAKYMMVICLLNNTDKTRNDVFTTPPALSITVSMPSKPISSVTTMSTRESVPATMIPRSTSTAAQLRCIAAAKKKREYNTAFKRATLMYAREKEKGISGMSARNVTELIQNEFKVNLCPQMIQKKVKEGNISLLLIWTCCSRGIRCPRQRVFTRKRRRKCNSG
jgi:hypothetical protein